MARSLYRTAFNWALSIHGTGLALVLILSLAHGCRDTHVETQVFEVVDLPLVDGPVSTPPGNSKPLAKLQHEPLKPIRVPKLNLPEPKGEESDDEPEPSPKPRPKAPPKPRPDAIPAPTKKPEKPSTMSYEEWLKKGGKKEVSKNQKKASKKGSSSGVDIKAEAERIKRSLAQGVADIQDADALGSGTGAVQSRETDYVMRLIARLRAAAPEVNSALSAKVRVSVTSDGQIFGELIQSSGDAVFDQQVMSTFDRVRRFEPPWDGRSKAYTVNFHFDD